MRLILLSFIIVATPASAFCPRLLQNENSRVQPYSLTFPLNLVTEDDVIALVEKAENLWSQVEKLRTDANDLSMQAESLGKEAETSTADAMNSLQG